MKRAILLLMVAATNACLERPELPQVPALAVAELSADDLEVVSAAWTATLRLEYENADAVPNSVVTPDKTIRACNVPEYQPSTYDCIEARDLIIVDGLMREFFGAMGPTTFHRRNSTTNQIRGEIQGMEVVPGDTLLELLQQPRWPWNLGKLFPGKSQVAIFSAPAYPASNEAVVYVLHVVSSASLVRLVRDRGVWMVHAVRGLWVS